MAMITGAKAVNTLEHYPGVQQSAQCYLRDESVWKEEQVADEGGLWVGSAASIPRPEANCTGNQMLVPVPTKKYQGDRAVSCSIVERCNAEGGASPPLGAGANSKDVTRPETD